MISLHFFVVYFISFHCVLYNLHPQVEMNIVQKRTSLRERFKCNKKYGVFLVPFLNILLNSTVVHSFNLIVEDISPAASLYLL